MCADIKTGFSNQNPLNKSLMDLKTNDRLKMGLNINNATNKISELEVILSPSGASIYTNHREWRYSYV